MNKDSIDTNQCSYDSKNDQIKLQGKQFSTLYTNSFLIELLNDFKEITNRELYYFKNRIDRFVIILTSKIYSINLKKYTIKENDLLIVIKIIVNGSRSLIPIVWQSSIINNWNSEELRISYASYIREEIEAALLAKPLSNSITVPIVLDQNLSSQLIHECIGHSSEADNYLNYFVDTPYTIGHRWSQLPLNVIDNPLEGNYRGGYLKDHENNVSKSTQIIKNGIWNDLLHCEYTADILNSKYSFNGRRTLYSNKIMPRMSVIYLLPGNEEVSNIIARIENGIYCSGTWGGGSFGQNFIIRPSFGKFIKDGELTDRMIRRFDIKGNKFDVISRINYISSDFRMFDNAFGCNKNEKQDLAVTQGSPHISILNQVLSPII